VRPSPSSFARSIALSAGYFALGMLFHAFPLAHANVVVVVFPPAGLGLAFALFWGTRVAPSLFLGHLAFSFATETPLVSALAGSLGVTIACVVGAKALLSRGFTGTIARTRDAASLVLVSVALCPAISTVSLAAPLALTGHITRSALPTFVVTHWLGHGLGQLLTTMLVLGLVRGPRVELDRARRLSLGGASLVLTALTIVVCMYNNAWWSSGARISLLLFLLAFTTRFRLREIAFLLSVPAITSLVTFAAIAWTERGTPLTEPVRYGANVAAMTILGLFATTLFSEQRVAREALERAKEEAEIASRAKSTFFATMSHEMRTPLNAVLGMTSLLLDTELSPEQAEFAETIRMSSESLLALISDVLDFSKIESGKIEIERAPMDVRECIDGAVFLLSQHAADKDLELIVSVEPNIPDMITCDLARTRQILVNLLSNAIKFTPSGEVVLRATVEPSNDPDAARIRFAVSDTGVGIAPEAQARLLQPFVQADASTTRRYGGTGLGLAISKRLAEAMGGAFGFSSEVGRGSTFFFTIQGEVVTPDEPRPSRRLDQPALTGKRALLAEDNATNRSALSETLKSWGIVVLPGTGRDEALTLLDAEQRVDVVIVDKSLAGPSPSEFIHAARGRRAGRAAAFVLMVSGQGKPADLPEGLVEVVSKPVRTDKLHEVLVRRFTPLRQRDGAGRPKALTFDPTMASSRPLRILVAEDNAMNQRVAVLFFNRMGYRVDIAASGTEVLAALSRQAYDVIFMDVQMPEMDGLEATQRIREDLPRETQPRIIAMTANAMVEDRAKCLSAGMDDYVSKPLRVEELTRALNGCQIVEATRRAPSSIRMRSYALDRAALDRLFELEAASGEGVVAELVDGFASETSASLKRMQSMLSGGDRESLGRTAHGLKSSSAMMGAALVSRAAAAIEAACREGAKTEDLDVMLSALDVEFKRVTPLLQAEVRRKPSRPEIA